MPFIVAVYIYSLYRQAVGYSQDWAGEMHFSRRTLLTLPSFSASLSASKGWYMLWIFAFIFFLPLELDPVGKMANYAFILLFTTLIHSLTCFVQRMFSSEQTSSISVSTNMGIPPFICVYGSRQAVSVPGRRSICPDPGEPSPSFGAPGGKRWLRPLFRRPCGRYSFIPLKKVFFVLWPTLLHRLCSVVLLPPGTRLVMSGKTTLMWRKAPRLL